MKIILFLSSLILLGALICCSEKEEEKEAASPEETPKVHPITELVRTKMDLEQQLESLISKADLSGNKELEDTIQKSREADLNFYQVQRNHPKLQKQYKKIAGWEGQSFSNPTQRAKARSLIQEVNSKIAEISATLPEVQSARTAQAEARKAIHDKKRELARQLPEAQPILDQLAEIDAQLVDARP